MCLCMFAWKPTVKFPKHMFIIQMRVCMAALELCNVRQQQHQQPNSSLWAWKVNWDSCRKVLLFLNGILMHICTCKNTYTRIIRSVACHGTTKCTREANESENERKNDCSKCIVRYLTPKRSLHSFLKSNFDAEHISNWIQTNFVSMKNKKSQLWYYPSK